MNGTAQLTSKKYQETQQQQEDSGGGGGTHGGSGDDISAPIEVPRKDSGDLSLNNNRDHNSNMTSDSEEGFLSTSPDSTNGENSGPVQQQKSITAITTSNEQILKKIPSNITTSQTTCNNSIVPIIPPPISLCTNPSNCVSLLNIVESFKTPLSEEQAWAVIYQCTMMYWTVAAQGGRHIFNDLEIPDKLENINLHRDGTVHCSWSETDFKIKEEKVRAAEQDSNGQQQKQQQQQQDDERGYENYALLNASHRKVLSKIAVIVYTALDYNLQEDEQCQMSQDLEELITNMTADAEIDDECIDEGIDEGYKRWDDDDMKFVETKEFDYVLEACKNHIKPTAPDVHYKAVCRALVAETIELRIFLHTVLNSSAENLHCESNSPNSKQELAKLGFNDWARFWVQVLDELRRGVRLKKANCIRTPIEYELTPYEILMEDIRSKKYQLRKVMVNGDIPPRVKKDAHALILEFIRSRPPLKKASERKLPPPIQHTPSPREQLMDSIRKGQTLKHIPPPTPKRLKDRLLPPSATTAITTTTMITSSTSSTATTTPSNKATAPTATTSTASTTSATILDESLKLHDSLEPHATPRSKQRLIKVDFSLLQDDDNLSPSCSGQLSSRTSTALCGTAASGAACSQPKMPPYPISGYIPSGTSQSSATAMKIAQNTNAAQIDLGTLNLPIHDPASQCDSRRASMRRHTIVGCQSNLDGSNFASIRPESSMTSSAFSSFASSSKKQPLKNSQNPNVSGVASTISTATAMSEANFEQQQQQLNSTSSVGVNPWSKSFLDQKTWQERGEDRLSLTLEEIVHIRSVMTKAELEGLPVGIRVKEDVEKRKVCFLCLRTRFSIFGPWGIQCKLCQRTVCSKCYTKMHLPSEHFRKVPLVLISPSLLATPASSGTPSPSHHGAHHTMTPTSSTGGARNMNDETFPKSLIERLLRSESERKPCHSVGSVPCSPRHQRSNMSTPGATAAADTAREALHEPGAMTASYTAGTHNSNYTSASMLNGEAGISASIGGYINNNRVQANNKHISHMSRSMEGPRSLPANSPGRTHSNSSTLERKSKFSRAFTLSSSGNLGSPSSDQKENVRGELVAVCHDCKGLVMEISRASKQTRSSERNRALKNLHLDLTPVYK